MQVVNLQAELSYLQAHLATLELPSPPPPPPLPPPTLVQPPPLSIADLPTASSMPATYDLSSLFDPMVQPASWAMPHQRLFDPRQYGGNIVRSHPSDHHIPMTSMGGSGDLQALASELFQGHNLSTSSGHGPCTDQASPSSSLS